MVRAKYFTLGILILSVIGMILVNGCAKEEIETREEVKSLEKTEYEKEFIPEEPPKEKLGLSFVEGDSESWDIQSSKMEKYVLSPSWFRFEYVSESSSLICTQFESLEDAKNKINQLSEVKKEPIEKSTGSYTLILSEKGMEETLVNLNIAISNFPPKDHAIYKYEAGEMKPKAKKEEKEYPPEPKAIKVEEETLSQKEKEFIEFLEEGDEQFDYLAVNRIRAGFRVSYFYEHPENSFTNQEVTGWKHWDTDLRNFKDESGEPIRGLGATFTTDLVTPNWRKQELIKMGPPVYVWIYDDFPQEEEHKAIFRPEAYIEFSNQLVSYAPGFDASRSADKTVFSTPGTQTLTITVIPRDENIEKFPKSDGIFMNIYTVEPGAENLVDAVIVSPTTDGEHIKVSEDRHSLRVYEQPVKTNVPWDITLTIEVTPKPGVSKAEFLPFISVLWNCGITTDPFGKGTTTGSSVSCPADNIGTWKWKAKGNYIWEWENGLNACSVAFPHVQKRVGDGS